MTLTIGAQLGSHEITALLGKGGMGEVYRARDTKMKRDVAVKVLPDEFARDAKSLATVRSILPGAAETGYVAREFACSFAPMGLGPLGAAAPTFLSKWPSAGVA